jgi:hypothetical protein
MAKKQKVAVVGWVLTAEYPTIGKKFSADISKYPQAMKDELCKHGAKQKFGDAESGGSPQDKYAMVQRIHEGLMQGNWELTSTPDMSGIILEAVSRLKKIPVAKLEPIAAKNPEKVKEWGGNVKVKAEIARIRAERAQKAADEAEDADLEIDIK